VPACACLYLNCASIEAEVEIHVPVASHQVTDARTTPKIFFNTLFQTHSTILQYNLLNQITLLYTTYTTFQIDYIKLRYTALRTYDV